MKKALAILLLFLTTYFVGSAQNCQTPFYYEEGAMPNPFLVQIQSSHLDSSTTTISAASKVFTHIWGSYLTDSLFIHISHENNSNTFDTIVVYAYAANDSFPYENNLLWTDSLITNQGLSPGNNWQGNNTATRLVFTPNVYINTPISFCVRYFGNPADTFAIITHDPTDYPICSHTIGTNAEWIIDDYSSNDLQHYWAIGTHGCMGLTEGDLAPEICGLSLDSTQTHWQLFWDNGSDQRINRIELRYSKEGPFGYHGAWGYTENSYYVLANQAIDNFIFTEKSDSTCYSIRMVAYDSLGNLLYLSILNPLRIKRYENYSGHAQLTLDNFIQQPVTTVITSDTIVIYKGASPYNLCPYDTLPAFAATYTDEAPGSYGYYYQLKRKLLSDCAIDSITSNIVPSAYLATPEQAYFETDITLYPNPAQTTLNINFGKATATDISIQVLNATGQLVYNCSKNAGAILTLDISALPTGLYLVQLQTGNTVKVQRFVKN